MMEHVYYADLLTQASQAPTTLEELPYLAAFVLSAYPHTIYRMAKPFNPLLGETFECDRRAEEGWRSFMEQVCVQRYHVCMCVHVASYPAGPFPIFAMLCTENMCARRGKQH